MSLQNTKQTLRIPRTLCKEFEERSIDMDILLADYCPDVTAILKCMIRPVITARYQSGDRYSVDGITTVRVLYLTEDRQTVHCFEALQPFNVHFRMNGAVHYYTDIKTDYVNCRAVSPRRIDIHGAFRVFLTACGEGTASVFSDPHDRNVFCQTHTVTSSIPMCEAEKAFLVDETIDLGVCADRLLYCDCVVDRCESKILTNKMIVKGTLRLKAAYGIDTQLCRNEQEIPFSQILDVDGLTEEWDCDTTVTVGECETHLQQNENGSSLLFFNCKLMACARCSKQESDEVVLDAYSVEHPLMCDTTPIETCVCHETHTSATSMQETLSLSDGICAIDDVFAELKGYEIRQTENDSCLTVCVLVGMITRDQAGYLGYCEKTVDFETPFKENGQDVHVRLLSVAASVYGDQVRIQAETETVCRVTQKETLNVVTDVAEDLKQSFPRCAASIRIVYADAGETLWQIAKTHHSSVEEIAAENDLSSPVITTATMLMIPTV